MHPTSPAPSHHGPRVDRHGRVLRELITAGLVEPVGGEEGRSDWRLTEPANQRVAELAEACAPPSSATMVVLGRRCQSCGLRSPTRLVDDRLLCDGCRRAEELAASAVPDGHDDSPRHHVPRRIAMGRKLRDGLLWLGMIEEDDDF